MSFLLRSPSRGRSISRGRTRVRKVSQVERENEETQEEIQETSAFTFFMIYFVTGVNQGCMFIYLGMMPVSNDKLT